MTSGPTSGPEHGDDASALGQGPARARGQKRKASAGDSEPNKMPRQWIGTWNNYAPEDVERFRVWCNSNTTYSICGHEVAPTTGTPHLQSFHQMKGRPRFSSFKTVFPSVAVTPVTQDNGCAAYCAKDDNVAFKTGEYIQKTPGRRTDLEAVAKMAQQGCTLRELADTHPTAVVQYSGGLKHLLSIYEKPRDRSRPKYVCCLWGATNLGKTRRIFDHIERLGETPYVWDPDMGVWWDGYAGQKYVIMDEFRGQMKRGSFLRLTDRYPYRVQCKGGSMQFVADYIYITSPTHPEDWYDDLGDDKKDQFLRRFHLIEKICTRDQECLLPPIAV